MSRKVIIERHAPELPPVCVATGATSGVEYHLVKMQYSPWWARFFFGAIGAWLTMRKAEVLLAFLALTPGIRHPRDRLINLLWSDRSDEQARNSLRQCLSTIRKALGDSADLALQIDRTTVCLKAETLDVE